MSSNVPPHGEHEILSSSGGDPAGVPTRAGGRRTALIAGGIVGGVALVGGVAWAATWYFSSGPDAAEALPESTIGFAQITLDPSGDQKIEALKTLNKFPGFKAELELDATDDVRKHLFEEIQKGGTCPDLDYGDDIEPWLGDRMAVAAVDLGEADPTPVFVVQVTDKDTAEDGLKKLQTCDSAGSGDATDSDSGSDNGGYVVAGEWAVVAETQDLAGQVVEEADKGTLADDEDYQRWTDEAGDDGIMTLYAAPEAGGQLVNLMDGGSGMASGYSGADGTSGTESLGSAVPAETVDQLKDFKGAAVKVRFSDGSIEAEFAAEVGNSDLAAAFAGDSGAEVVATLPDDTALALGGSFGEGWFTALLEWAADAAGGTSADELLSEAETESGLDLPDDAETLTGEAFAIAMSSDIDVDALVNNDDASNSGIGMKVKGDPEAIEEVLDKIRPQTGDETLLQSKASGDYLSFGPDEDWLDALSDDGDLDSLDTYRDVVPESDRANSVVYLNADAGDDWLVKALEDSGMPDDVIENVEPFSALGVSSWFDGNTVHGLVKLTTD